jgi:hypothetical protein
MRLLDRFYPAVNNIHFLSANGGRLDLGYESLHPTIPV